MRVILAKPINRRKIPVLTAGKVRKFLRAHGFVLDRTQGSHFTMIKTDRNGDEISVTVAGSDDKEIPIGTLMNIVRESKIPESEWRNFRY